MLVKVPFWRVQPDALLYPYLSPTGGVPIVGTQARRTAHALARNATMSDATFPQEPHAAAPSLLSNGRPRRSVRPSVQLERHRPEIRAIVARHRGANPRVFGSVLQGTDTKDSDLDLLIDPAPGQRMTLFDLSAIYCEIEDLLGVPIDLQTSASMPVTIRTRIEREARPVLKGRVPGTMLRTCWRRSAASRATRQD